MYGACVTTNKDGHMPHDIARIHGHTELADMLKHFSEFVKAGNHNIYISSNKYAHCYYYNRKLKEHTL
jgi:hypothetical protein